MRSNDRLSAALSEMLLDALGERLSLGGMAAMRARQASNSDQPGIPTRNEAVEFESEYHLPGFIVGKTGERRESRVVTVEEYAWTCERCRARGVDYEDELSALIASVRHQHAVHGPPSAQDPS